MSYTTTYTALLAEIQATVEDTAAEFVTNLPSIINRGEARCIKDLDLEIWQAESTGSLTASSRVLVRPTTAKDITDIFITVSSADVTLLPRTDGWLRLYSPDSTVEGQPKYYAEEDGTDIHVVPTPDSAYAYTIRHVVRPTKLSSGNQTNWLTDNVAELLFYSCLMDTEAWLLGDERILVWRQAYTDALNSAVDNFRGLRRNDYHPLRTAPKIERRA